MDMMEALKTASVKVDQSNRFDARQAFGKRVGKHMIFPVGLGSALAKAVREGYLLVVGAYPPGQHADIQKSAPSAEGRDRIRILPLPDSDPLYGPDGPLMRLWRKAAA